MKFYLAIYILLMLGGSLYAQQDDQIFTIYLVRHAEKQVPTNGSKDPSLTPCGLQRAESLAGFLTNVDLKSIYSTNYTRTKNTAQPTANAKGLEMEMYNPRALNDFAELLVDRRQDALVVGHSNTTGVLAGLLIGEEIGSFDESIYNRIYQVVISNEQGRLHILESAFVCGD